MRKTVHCGKEKRTVERISIEQLEDRWTRLDGFWVIEITSAEENKAVDHPSVP